MVRPQRIGYEGAVYHVTARATSGGRLLSHRATESQSSEDGGFGFRLVCMFRGFVSSFVLCQNLRPSA